MTYRLNSICENFRLSFGKKEKLEFNRDPCSGCRCVKEFQIYHDMHFIVYLKKTAEDLIVVKLKEVK